MPLGYEGSDLRQQGCPRCVDVGARIGLRDSISYPVGTSALDVVDVLGEGSSQPIGFLLLRLAVRETLPLVGIRLGIVLQLLANSCGVCQPVVAIVCKDIIDLSLDAFALFHQLAVLLFHADDFSSIGLHGSLCLQLCRICLGFVAVERFLLVNESVDVLLQAFSLSLSCFQCGD